MNRENSSSYQLNHINANELMVLRDQSWPPDVPPMVSICCITYNHEKYIRNAIEGFLMQKTNFPVEILIHDDASTDNTAAIIKAYERRYPHLLKPIYQPTNQFSQGKKPGIINRKRAKGKYIAFCEGDDYWTDPLKLQKQIHFLETHPEYSMCFHNAQIEDCKDRSASPKLFAEIENRDYSISDLLERWLIPTASAVFRRSIQIPEDYLVYHIGDLPIFLFLAHHGKIFGSNEVMSVYRKVSNSLTHIMSKNEIEYKIKYIEMFKALDRYYNFQYHRFFKKTIGRYYFYLASVYLKQKRYLSILMPLLKSIWLHPFYITSIFSPKIGLGQSK